MRQFPEDSLYPPTILRVLGDFLDVLPVSTDAVSYLSYLPHEPGRIISYAHLVGYILPIAGKWTLTEVGNRIRESNDRYRSAVMDVTERFRPEWIALVAQGRSAIERYHAHSPLLQCLHETGLLIATDPEAVSFWDQLGGAARENHDRDLLITGRTGERLTINFEHERTNQHPRWRALEIDGLGYDVESIRTAEDQRPLYIEVKASAQKWHRAHAYLTRREWQFLTNHHDDAVIDLWSIVDQEIWHRRVSPMAIACHIPINQGTGIWDTCRISYVALLGNPFT